MHFRDIFFAFLFTLFICCVSDRINAQVEEPGYPKSPPRDLHIYLLIGQSNMAGRAGVSMEDKDPIDRCYLFQGDSKWVPATNPLNRFSSIRKNLSMQKMNPGYAFAKTMLAHQKNNRIGLVVNAKGGTKIEQWEKGTFFYDEAIKRVRLACKQGTIKGVLWHQGESNASMPAGYLEKLKKLVTDLRKDLNSPKLPFIAGQIKGDQAINVELAKLPDQLSFTNVVSSKDLTTFDRWHFDTRSMKRLGERYGQAMLAMQKSVIDPFVR